MILSQEQIDSFEVFQYKICAFSLPFHSGLWTGRCGVTEINYESTDIVR